MNKMVQTIEKKSLVSNIGTYTVREYFFFLKNFSNFTSESSVFVRSTLKKLLKTLKKYKHEYKYFIECIYSINIENKKGNINI